MLPQTRKKPYSRMNDMKNILKTLIISASFLTLFLPSAFCEKIIFSANSMSGTVGDKSDSTTLSGEAYVLTESMEISADKITMSGKDFRFIEAEGSIIGKNMESELEFTCNRLKYDRETKIANLSDTVNLTDVKNNVTAKAQLIEYNQNTDIAVMQIDIELKQKDNTCTGVYAVYRKNDQMLELSGNAQIKQGSDTFRAQEITLNLTSQEITLDGRVKGSIVDERKTSSAKNEAAETQENQQDEETAETSGDTAQETEEEKPDGNTESEAEAAKAEEKEDKQKNE